MQQLQSFLYMVGASLIFLTMSTFIFAQLSDYYRKLLFIAFRFMYVCFYVKNETSFLYGIYIVPIVLTLVVSIFEGTFVVISTWFIFNLCTFLDFQGHISSIFVGSTLLVAIGLLLRWQRIQNEVLQVFIVPFLTVTVHMFGYFLLFRG